MYNFNSLAPCGANLIICATCGFCCAFQLTRPVWGEPVAILPPFILYQFQLTRPVWGEPEDRVFYDRRQQISTHSPRVGRTELCWRSVYPKSRFQLTRPVWSEPGEAWVVDRSSRISTHSPRVGRTWATRTEFIALTISTHSPRVGRTHTGKTIDELYADFNSLAPCGANPSSLCLPSTSATISTHSPRGGRTAPISRFLRFLDNFNSLAPCGANLSA